MSAESELRRRPFLNATHWPEIPPLENPDDYEDIRLTYWEEVQLSWTRFWVNLQPDTLEYLEKHPTLKKAYSWRRVATVIIIAIVLLLFRVKLEPKYVNLPWYVELHEVWLHDYHIHESTWILDEEAQTHTSNDPSLKETVLLQFPQRSGGSSITLRDVQYDSKAYYGVISMKKLEEDHVPMRLLFGVGEVERPVMGVEIIGRDIVAMTWGGKGTYMLKAWSLRRCVLSCPKDWTLRSVRRLFTRWTPEEIPAKVMRQLVDKHRTIPAAAKDESVTPWQQRALDEEHVMVQKAKKKSYWF